MLEVQLFIINIVLIVLGVGAIGCAIKEFAKGVKREKKTEQVLRALGYLVFAAVLVVLALVKVKR
jgi:uncharacterized membrane protein YidH (DUF202 family)